MEADQCQHLTCGIKSSSDNTDGLVLEALFRQFVRREFGTENDFKDCAPSGFLRLTVAQKLANAAV